MKKYIIGILVLLCVGLGLIYSNSHKQKLGGSPVETNAPWFYNGFSAGQTSTSGISGSKFSVDTTGTLSIATQTVSSVLTSADFNSATVGSSSSSPSALGSAIAGHFVIAAGGNTAQASTTTVTLNSSIFLQQELTTPIAGTTCNTAIASDTVVSTKVAGNGFTVTNSYSPVTNPQCEAYWIIN